MYINKYIICRVGGMVKMQIKQFVTKLKVKLEKMIKPNLKTKIASRLWFYYSKICFRANFQINIKRRGPLFHKRVFPLKPCFLELRRRFPTGWSKPKNHIRITSCPYIFWPLGFISITAPENGQQPTQVPELPSFSYVRNISQ